MTFSRSSRPALWGLVILISLTAALPSAPPAVLGQGPQAQVVGSWQHPRFFFSESDIPALQARAATTHRDIWEPIADFANVIAESGVPLTHPSDYDSLVFANYGKNIIVLAFACTITADDATCKLATDYLLAILGWARWDVPNERGLGHAHILLSAALGYDWLYNRLAPQEQQFARDALAERARQLYEASVEPRRDEWNNWWGKSYVQNYYWIMHSGLGMAALALLDEQPALLCPVQANRVVNVRAEPSTQSDLVGSLQPGQVVDIRGRAEGSDGFVWWMLEPGRWVREDVVVPLAECAGQKLDPMIWLDHAQVKMSIAMDVLNGIGDGSWHESIHYQDFWMPVTLPFLENLKRLWGTDLRPHLYLQNYIYWRLYNFLPETTVPLFTYGDLELEWQEAAASWSSLRYAASLYQDGHAEWLAQQLIDVTGRVRNPWGTPWYVFEFFYYDPGVTPLPPDALPGNRAFEDLEGVIWRTGWRYDDLVFGLKTGAYGGRFAFESFVNQDYPWEPGAALNTAHNHDDTNGFYLYANGHWLAPETVGVGAYATALHNTLLIDGGQYRPPDEHYGCCPEDYAGRDGYLEAVANTPHFNYVAANARQRYTAPDLEAVTRHVVFVRPAYFLMLDHVAGTVPHDYEWVMHVGRNVVLNDGAWIRAESSDEQFLGIAVAAPHPYQARTGDDGKPYVRISPLEQVASTRFIHVLYPATATTWADRPDVALISDSGQAALIEVRASQGEVDTLLVNYGASGAVTLGALTFDGRVAVIRRNADGEIASLFLYGGGFLSVDGTVLANQLDPDLPFEVVYDGSVAQVSSAQQTGVWLYAPPHITELTVNGALTTFARSGDYISFGG